MTEQRQKLADLPQEEREQLIKEAQDAGLNSTQIANWYVDTLRAKIADKKQKQNAAADKADAEKNKADNAAAPAEDAKADDAADKADAPADVSDIDPNAEAEDLDKDVEPAAPKTPAKQNKAQKSAEPDVVTICHICRSKVVNGKCTGCGFEIAKR